MPSAVGNPFANRIDLRRAAGLIGVLTVVMSSVLGVTGSAVAGAQEPERISVEDPAQQLVERFAPIIMMKEQEEECDTDGEQYLPTSVEIVLDNPEVALRQVGPGDPVVTWAPGAADLIGLGEGFFLDFPGSSLSPGCISNATSASTSAISPPRSTPTSCSRRTHPTSSCVQYWIYWYYNDWNNKHESDWEGISLLFEASSIEEALASEPSRSGLLTARRWRAGGVAGRQAGARGRPPGRLLVSGIARQLLRIGGLPGQRSLGRVRVRQHDRPSERVAPEVVLLPD